MWGVPEGVHYTLYTLQYSLWVSLLKPPTPSDMTEHLRISSRKKNRSTYTV
jgi:hypothetical protein